MEEPQKNYAKQKKKGISHKGSFMWNVQKTQIWRHRKWICGSLGLRIKGRLTVSGRQGSNWGES